jgi:hypothetical protein
MEKLSHAHQVGCFVSGLNESIRTEVQPGKPKTLTATMGLVHLFEAHVSAKKKMTSSFDSRQEPSQ